MVGAFEGDVLLDAGDFERRDAGGFEFADDFLPQRFGQVVGAVVGDTGCAEEKFGELGGGFPVEVLECFEGGGDEVGRDDGFGAGVERGAVEEEAEGDEIGARRKRRWRIWRGRGG